MKKYNTGFVFSCLVRAIKEHYQFGKKWRTDVFGIARRYSGRKVSKEEFLELSEMKLKDIIEKIFEEDKKM